MDRSSLTLLSRRGLIASSAAAPAAAMAASPARASSSAPASAAEQAQKALAATRGTKLVILGSGGGPTPGRTRQMTPT